MSLNPPSTASPPGLVARARGLICSPCAEWARIEAEPVTVRQLFVRLVLPLAAIGPLALAVNGLFFPHPHLGLVVRWPVAAIVLGALIVYLLSLVMTWLLALAIDSLAPGFRGCKNRVQAFKVAAYAGVAGWLAGVFGAAPWLAPLMLLGVAYSLFLLYRGLPRLMRTPADQALGYTATTAGVALAFGVLVFVALGSVGAALSCFAGLGGGEAPFAPPPGAERLAGAGGVDPAQLAAAARQAQLAQAREKAAGGARAHAPLTPAQLQALLPGAVGELSRVSLSGQSRSAAGYVATTGEARYRSGTARLTLSVTDLRGASAVSAFAQALDLNRVRRTADNYQSVATVDGRPTFEQFDRRHVRGRYAVLVADRFLVMADAEGCPIETLRQAVQAVGFDHLAALARAG